MSASADRMSRRCRDEQQPPSSPEPDEAPRSPNLTVLALQRSVGNATVARAALALQRSVGNAAVARIIARCQSTAENPDVAYLVGEPRFPALWREFTLVVGVDDSKARALAPQVVDALNDRDHIRDHGLGLADWLLGEGLDELAARVLSRLETTWEVAWAVDEDVMVRGVFEMRSVTPLSLLERGEAAARRGAHAAAHDILTRAFMLLGFAIEIETRRRSGVVGATPPDVAQAGVLPAIRRLVYEEIGAMYEGMRRILRLHRKLSRELESAGDPAGARAAQAAGERLREAIFARYIPPAELMIAEVTEVEIVSGTALRLHGANDASTILTQLPGLDPPSEVGSNIQHEPAGTVAEALAGQVDLLEDLLREPEVARAFPAGDIDMNNVEDRIRVWNAMFRAFRQQAGSGALELLMKLIGRYLEAFTVHTEYNVRDWGVSYLEEELPTDLTGRAERDCGVYALTVAYELYRAASEASPQLALDFQFVAAPEHIMLVIRDGANLYLVNNNQVTGPHTGTTVIAGAQARVRGVTHLVTPAVVTPAGTTGMMDAAFRTNLWERYQDATSWGLEAETPIGPDAFRSEDERREAAYARMYAEQEEFSLGTARLGASLDRLDDRLEEPDADRDEVIGVALEDLRPLYKRLADLLLRYTKFPEDDPGHQRRIGSVHRPHAQVEWGYLVASLSSRGHPLTRVVDRLNELEGLGRTLSTEDVEYRDKVALIPELRNPANP